jgi:glycosyltransferase involved in cell wall biosynthesis
VPFEVYVEAERLFGRTGRVRFCRLSVYTKQFEAIGFDTILAAYLNPPGTNAPWKTIWAPAIFWSKFSGMLPVIARNPRFFLSIFKTAVHDLADLLIHRRRFERSVREGDIVVSLGASWGVPRYMTYIAQAKRRYGIRFSILIHDLIAFENASFVDQRHVVQFRYWLQQAIPQADVIFTISKHSRNALVKLAATAGWSLPRVEVAELGSGLSDRPLAGGPRPINLPKRYVLFVSTIEIRKNHRLLVAVWRRLLKRYDAQFIPNLIFAGQIGWSVDDLLADLAASKCLDGKIVLMPGLSDAQLIEAYRSCLFTVFPSLDEGWGLPVAESLVQGKFCVASNRTSIPEVGGDLIDYFDPSSEDDALAKIERLLLEPSYLAAREVRLRAEYHPRSWADCVHGLIGTLD